MSKIKENSKRCRTSSNCHVSEHCDISTHFCVPNIKPGHPCIRFVRALTCGEEMRCNSITSRCVSDKKPHFLASIFGLASYDGYPSNGCGRKDIDIPSEEYNQGCASFPCESSLDCATDEFCGIFVDVNGKKAPFNPNPAPDNKLLEVRVVGPEADDLAYSLTKGFCIRHQSLNGYCTSDNMCAEGLGCDLGSSSKCKIICYSNEDCSSQSLYSTYPRLFNESIRQRLTNGECFPLSSSLNNPGFCIGYEKPSSTSIQPASTSNGSFFITENIANTPLLFNPYYFLIAAMIVMVVILLGSVWCCSGGRGTDKLSRIRRQQKEFVRLARSGAAPPSSLFTSTLKDHLQTTQPLSASYPWNNPSRN